MAAMTEDRYSSHIGESPPLRDTLPTIPPNRHNENESSSDKTYLLNIYHAIRQDKSFDDIIDAKEENKFTALFSHRNVVAKLNEHIKQWKHEKSWITRQDLNARVKELFSTAVVTHGATGFPPTKESDNGDGVRLDFFLMHALTSAYFIHILVPHLHPEEAASLIQAHHLSTLSHYLIVGRPEVKIDRLLEYDSPSFRKVDPQQPHRRWAHVLEGAVGEDEHVIKAIRACAEASILYNDDPDWFDDALYLRAAELTYDLHDNWTFGVGFD